MYCVEQNENNFATLVGFELTTSRLQSQLLNHYTVELLLKCYVFMFHTKFKLESLMVWYTGRDVSVISRGYTSRQNEIQQSLIYNITFLQNKANLYRCGWQYFNAILVAFMLVMSLWWQKYNSIFLDQEISFNKMAGNKALWKGKCGQHISYNAFYVLYVLPTDFADFFLSKYVCNRLANSFGIMIFIRKRYVFWQIFSCYKHQ